MMAEGNVFYIGYHNQVPRVNNACNIEFGSMLNLSNYGHFFITTLED